MENKKNMRLEPKGGRFGFFGWHVVPADAREIVLTEGEFDAIAVYQATKMPAVSLPNGAHSLPVNLIPLLERFERIFLWLDDDVAGQEGAKKFAQKLGVHRCYIVQSKDGDAAGPKDANDALKMGKDLRYLILKAKRPTHDQVVTFSEVRREVELELLHPEQAAGIQSLWFPSFNAILKGHRKGEVTVITGATGIGKTTLLSQMSLDFCLQGVRTLWGSFELQLPRLVKKMLFQYANKNLTECVDEFEVIADRFGSLPMYFLRFFGSTQVDQVLDAMEYAVYVHDVEHIVIDNIQFMTSCQGKGMERFEVIDDAIHKFRQFATHHSVHLTLVIHPRKQDDELPLSMADVFGNAKATQEADNVIILQRNKQTKYLDIRKNRYSGDLGRIPLYFDKPVQRFSQPPQDTPYQTNGPRTNQPKHGAVKSSPSPSKRYVYTRIDNKPQDTNIATQKSGDKG
jgi:twinkle protein